MSYLKSFAGKGALATIVGLSVSLVASMNGCIGATEGPETETRSEEALQSGAGSSTKTKGDLQADGYTCSALEGTTVTLCYKSGSPSYSCDPKGRCIQNLTKGRQTLHPPVRGAVRAF